MKSRGLGDVYKRQALYMLMAVLVATASRRSTDLRAPLALVAVNVAYTLLSPAVSLWGHLGGLAAGRQWRGR